MWIRDGFGQNLAMMLSFGEDRVRGWPTVALFMVYKDDMGTPLWVPPGITWTPEGFVYMLARFAAWDKGNGLHLTAHSRTGDTYNDVNLTRHMDARQIAALTGFDLRMVRDVLANHLTITPEPEAPGA